MLIIRLPWLSLHCLIYREIESPPLMLKALVLMFRDTELMNDIVSCSEMCSNSGVDAIRSFAPRLLLRGYNQGI